MNDRDGDGFLVALFMIAVVGLICWMIGDNNGHKRGVEDHAAGRYVVVAMPDGTTQVCEVKEKTDGK